jgi:N-formylglutamate amidohydrolase
MALVILHIPHASTHIPSRAAYLLSDEALEAEILRLTDWYTDDLFNDGQDLQIVAKFSRLYCDVERFAYDDMEVMAPFGMGAFHFIHHYIISPLHRSISRMPAIPWD